MCRYLYTPIRRYGKNVGLDLDLAENTDYKALTISFAEDEDTELGRSKEKNVFRYHERPYVQDAWRFLISENNSSGILADKVGFTYKKTVSKAGVVDYIHAAALIIISPEGKITRYLNGIEQLPFDVKMAVMESAARESRTNHSKKLLYCFTYDPKGKNIYFCMGKNSSNSNVCYYDYLSLSSL